jgi:hypothetical protein
MNVQAPFGFVTGCHAGDKYMVQATLASLRHFCAHVPVCLTVDGDVDVSDLEREYHPIVLRVRDLPSAEMRQTIGKSFHAKHAAMWAGPFEFYVWLDSDAIVWGDFTAQIRPDLDFQILWNEISVPADAREVPPWLPHFYFDPEKLRRFDPDFDWRGKAYFCAGVFAARRNAISYEHYCQILKLDRAEPGMFAWGDMGMLNYMVHSLAQRGQLKTALTDLQHIPDHHGTKEFEQDCTGWRFPETVRRPRIGHFCGRKPYLFDRRAYARPFTIARLEHYRRHHGELVSWLKVLNEERRVLAEKIKRRLSAPNKNK